MPQGRSLVLWRIIGLILVLSITSYLLRQWQPEHSDDDSTNLQDSISSAAIMRKPRIDEGQDISSASRLKALALLRPIEGVWNSELHALDEGLLDLTPVPILPEYDEVARHIYAHVDVDA